MWQFSGKLLGSPASSHKLPITVQRKREAPVLQTSRGFFRGPRGDGPTLGAQGLRYQAKLIMLGVCPGKKVRKGVSHGATGYPLRGTYL